MAILLKFIGLAAIAHLINGVTAANLIVGGPNGGWDLSTDLRSWSSSQTFAHQISSSCFAAFSFGSFHSVVEVPKADYAACTMNNPIKTYTGGSAVIKLSTSGKRYFICGTPGHCSQGMKMEINIVSGSATTNAPAASPVNPTPVVSSPAPGASPTASSPSLPAHAPVIPSPALSPVVETLMPPAQPSEAAAGLSPQATQEKNSGGRPVVAGIVLGFCLLMALA